MNIKEAFNFTKLKLKEAGVEDPAFDAIYLFEYVFNMGRTDVIIHADDVVLDKDFEKLCDCIKRRENDEPHQYITQTAYFMGNTYFVKDGVLIPRDDTEVVVNACIEYLDKNECKNILDLCSGSGIIAITLKKLYPDLSVFAVEKSELAFPVLSKNCETNGAQVNAVHADLYDCVNDFSDGFFDLIVSNPPYIISDEISTLQREVQFEPKLALDGGEDGYDFYKGIIKEYSKKLAVGGMLAFEIGEGQFDFICDLLHKASFENIKSYLDLGNTIRAITAIYSPET